MRRCLIYPTGQCWQGSATFPRYVWTLGYIYYPIDDIPRVCRDVDSFPYLALGPDWGIKYILL